MALNVELLAQSFDRILTKRLFVLLRILQRSSEFIVETIGNVACFLSKSFDL